MPAMIRPNPKTAKALYEILSIPKEQQQKSRKEPTPKERKAWDADTNFTG